MKIFHGFCYAFLIFFGMFILYFNLCCALNLSPLPGFVSQEYTFWDDNHYFGFSSVMAFFNSENKPFGLTNPLLDPDNGLLGVDTGMSLFMDSLGGLSDTFNTISKVLNGNADILDILKIFFKIFTAPLEAIVAFIKITILIVTIIIDFLSYFIMFLFGNNLSSMSIWNGEINTTASGVYQLTVVDGVVTGSYV